MRFYEEGFVVTDHSYRWQSLQRFFLALPLSSWVLWIYHFPAVWNSFWILLKAKGNGFSLEDASSEQCKCFSFFRFFFFFARACALLQCMVGSGLLWGLWSSLTLLSAWKTSALGLNYSLLKLLHLHVIQQAAWEPWQSQIYQEAFRNAMPFRFLIRKNKLYSWEFRQYDCLGSKNNCFFFLKWEISSIQVTREDFFFYQIFDFWEKKLWFDHYVLCFYLRHQSVLSTFFVFYVPSFGCF